MMISTKGRYALRIMLDIAVQKGSEYIPLKDVAARQGLSVKYLETIVAVLNRAGMLESQRGKSGGYRLSREPEEYTVGSILKLSEGSLAPVACLEGEQVECPNSVNCMTLPLWRELDVLIDGYLEKITLRDLIEKKL